MATHGFSRSKAKCRESYVENMLFDGDGAMQRDAIGELLDGCRQYLLLIAHHELGHDLQSKAGASDLVQDTLMEAYAAFDRRQGTTQPELLAWLRQILLHNVANFKRRYQQTGKRQVTREVSVHTGGPDGAFRDLIEADASSPSERAIRAEVADRVSRALSRLSDDYRRVVELRNREHKSFAEVGLLMDRSPDAARMLWVRAVEQLARELEDVDARERSVG